MWTINARGYFATIILWCTGRYQTLWILYNQMLPIIHKTLNDHFFLSLQNVTFCAKALLTWVYVKVTLKNIAVLYNVRIRLALHLYDDKDVLKYNANFSEFIAAWRGTPHTIQMWCATTFGKEIYSALCNAYINILK